MPQKEPHFQFSMLQPKYWLTWIGLGLGWIAAQLPYSIQIRIGRLLGKFIKKTSANRVHIARTNLTVCFPEKKPNEIDQLVNDSFESLGIATMEIIMSWWASNRKLKNLVTIEGLEHLEKALAKNKGVILLSGHFTTLELGGRLLTLFASFHALYRKHKNPIIEFVMHRSRVRHIEKAIERRNMVGMIRSLKENNAIWYAPDQDYGRGKSIFATFFNVPAATITSTMRLASMRGSPVVPFFQQRLKNGKGYVLRLYPELDNFPSGDDLSDAQRINNIIEQEILKMPEQYLWSHRRFKTRPENLPSIY